MENEKQTREELKEKIMEQLDKLEQVSGGGKHPSGGTVLRFPDNCPQCGAEIEGTP